MSDISVIIPTLNAEKNIDNLIKKLRTQTTTPDEIIVIDSESDDHTADICKKYKDINFIEIKRKNFDHGGTRDLAFRKSKGDIVLFITQDAEPTDEYYIEKLIEPFKDENVAMTTGRQVARNDASNIERLTREFNYPDTNYVRTKEDISTLGIKTFFVSDVCAAYRRKDYIDVGGFKNPIIISEDMIIAADFIHADKKIAYVADAKVIHSHNYTLKQQFVRNFDTGVVMKMYEDKFTNISAQMEGIKMVKVILKKLIASGSFFQAFYYCLECGAKLLGNRLGDNYTKLSNKMILKCTMSKNFWLNYRNFEQ